jgi:hypothetical protein
VLPPLLFSSRLDPVIRRSKETSKPNDKHQCSSMSYVERFCVFLLCCGPRVKVECVVMCSTRFPNVGYIKDDGNERRPSKRCYGFLLRAHIRRVCTDVIAGPKAILAGDSEDSKMFDVRASCPSYFAILLRKI